MNKDDALAILRVAAADMAAAAAALERARIEREQAVSAAVGAGVPKALIARMLQTSRTHVRRILGGPE